MVEGGTARFVSGSAMFSTTDRDESGGARIKASMEWGTPQELFDGLNERFGPFELDAAASDVNHKCERYFTAEDDALTQDCNAEKVWLNPPFSANVGAWIDKAAREIEWGNCGQVWVLVPARTDTKWFHESVLPNADDIYFLKGRLTYERWNDDGERIKSKPAPFPSMLINLGGGGCSVHVMQMSRQGEAVEPMYMPRESTLE